MPYSNDFYESLYTKPWEDTGQERLKRLYSKDVARYRVKTIKSGSMLECEIYPLWSTSAAAGRAKKAHKSRKVQENLNEKNAKKQIVRLVNTNFAQTDIWMTCTCDSVHLPKSDEEAERMVKNFIRRVKYRRKKLGLPALRYIYVMEHREATKAEPAIRYHFHLILSGDMDRDELEQLWQGGGRREAHRLQPDEFGLEGLARYMVKLKAGKRRWGASTNLKKPIVTTADHKITKRQAEHIAQDENAAPALFQKLYPDYLFTDMRVYRSDVVPGAYIYVRMRESPQKRKRKGRTKNAS